MNKFKFHNVGQGLFYSGSLMHGTYNFVFDCGSENKQHLIEAIDRYRCNACCDKSKRRRLDFVVVSHLHQDHFNGLYKLLTECKVDKLYLPYLGSNESFIRFALAYAIFYRVDKNSRDDENTDMLMRRNNLYKFMLYLYGVQDDQFDVHIEEIIFLNPNNKAYKTKRNSSGEVYVADEILVEQKNYCYWKFRIVNKMIAYNIFNDLVRDINNLVRDKSDIVEYVVENAEAIEKIAESYKVFFGEKNKYGLKGGMNISSMIMIHYPLYNNARACYIRHNDLSLDDYYRYIAKMHCVCLRDRDLFRVIRDDAVSVLTGDAVIDGTYFWGYENINDFFLLQVPHHGAKENWDAVNKMELTSRVYVIPFGLGNRHKHPHSDTISALRNKELYNVTQLEPFEYIID